LKPIIEYNRYILEILYPQDNLSLMQSRPNSSELLDGFPYLAAIFCHA